MILFVFCLVPFPLIFTFKHARQRGTEDAMIYLSKQAHNGKVKNILFLMPCHATPYYSTLHCNVTMRLLDCSPRFGLANLVGLYILFSHVVLTCCYSKFLHWSDISSDSEEKGIPDESDRFMMDPIGFATEFAKNWSLPSHIVLFYSEERLLRDFLVSHSFKEVCAKLRFISFAYIIFAFGDIYFFSFIC